jgi:hypothetical protein
VSGRQKAIVGVVAALVMGAVIVIRLVTDRPAPAPDAARAGPPGFLPGLGPALPVPQLTPEQQVASVMAAWRAAILAHDPETVMTCNNTFLGEPRDFTPALVESAQHDENERVRAFSTRVLGKLNDPQLIGTFRKLLGDESAFVRQNAAWGLGQLDTRAYGAAGDLEKVKVRDKIEDVRRAAAEALQRVRGLAPPQRRAG